MARRLAAAVIIALLAVAAHAVQVDAHNVGLRHTAMHRYNHCKRYFAHQNHGRACGRNIIALGWKARGKPAVEPSLKQIAKWSRALNRLSHPMAYLYTHGVQPRTPTGNGAATPSYSPASGLAACIIRAESGGNSRASNASGHKGIAQWSDEAWNRHQRAGGHYFGPTALSATYQQQLIVLNDGLTHYGCIDWCPYDTC